MLCYHCMREKGDAEVCPFCGAAGMPDVQAHHLLPGTVIGGRYTIGKVLGEGGFGITYIGKRDRLDKIVAIKEYFPHGYCNRNTTYDASVSVTAGSHQDFFEQGRARFLREAKTLAKFQNDSGIVDVIDFLEENNTAYIVMEYLDGVTLRDYLKEHGVFDCVEVIRMLMPMMQALEKVHAAGVIHRDISPDNIMLLKNGTLKLMDFGAARDYDGDNRSMSVMLKQGYAPEEQYRRNGKQGPWTDVYGLCATIYRCITGSVPVESLDRIRQDDLRAPSTFGIKITPSLEKALLYGMAVDKDDRCPDMGTLIALFERAMSGEDLTMIADVAVTDPRPQEMPYDPNATVRAEETLPPYPPQQRYPQQPAYPQHPYQQPYVPMPPVQPAPQKKRTNGAVIAVVCIILALLIGGGAVTAAVLINRDDDDHSSSSQSGNETQAPYTTPAEETEAAIKMPNLIGMSKEDAIDKLAEYDLTVSEFIETESNAQSPGKVFSQSPKKDKDVTESTKIKLYIAKAMPTEKPTTKPTEKATEKPSGNTSGGSSSGTTYYSTADTYVSLRESTGSNAAEIRKIWNGQAMKYISSSGDWYYVEAGGSYGYVSSKYVSSSYSDVPMGSATVYVNSNVDDLKLRSSASENASILEKIPPGAAVSFSGIVQDNGYTRSDGYHVQWAYVTYNGSSGFVYDYYVHD